MRGLSRQTRAVSDEHLSGDTNGQVENDEGHIIGHIRMTLMTHTGKRHGAEGKGTV